MTEHDRIKNTYRFIVDEVSEFKNELKPPCIVNLSDFNEVCDYAKDIMIKIELMTDELKPLFEITKIENGKYLNTPNNLYELCEKAETAINDWRGNHYSL